MIDGVVGSQGSDIIDRIGVRIKYKVELTLKLTYLVATGLVFLFSAYFFSTFQAGAGATSAGVGAGRSGTGIVLTSILPLILTVWGVLARLRAHESLVADKLRPCILIAILSAALTSGYFLYHTLAIADRIVSPVFKWISRGYSMDVLGVSP